MIFWFTAVFKRVSRLCCTRNVIFILFGLPYRCTRRVYYNVPNIVITTRDEYTYRLPNLRVYYIHIQVCPGIILRSERGSYRILGLRLQITDSAVVK